MKNKYRNQPIKVLFLCSDNYSRSVTADFCFRNFLSINNDYRFLSESAGINTSTDVSKYSNAHFLRMQELGIDTTPYKRTQFSNDMLTNFDVVVAMGQEHVDFIREKYNQTIPLFNELYTKEKSSILVAKPSQSSNLDQQLSQLVDYINNSMSAFVKNLSDYYYQNK